MHYHGDGGGKFKNVGKIKPTDNGCVYMRYC